MGAGEELDLVGAVGPEVRKADDRTVDDRDERVEPGVGAFEVQAGDDVGRRRARNPWCTSVQAFRNSQSGLTSASVPGRISTSWDIRIPFREGPSSRRGSAIRRGEEAWDR